LKGQVGIFGASRIGRVDAQFLAFERRPRPFRPFLDHFRFLKEKPKMRPALISSLKAVLASGPSSQVKNRSQDLGGKGPIEKKEEEKKPHPQEGENPRDSFHGFPPFFRA
jgi:hypothetical protein